MKQKESPIVFTPDWIQTAKSRHDSRPGFQQPWPYCIATEDKFYSVRQQIEDWVASLPATMQTKTIANLQEDKSFWQTYHELAIGSLLKNLGLRTAFQKDVNDYTPDWYVSPSDGSQPFIVEVLTDNISTSETSRNKQIDDLQHRLSAIPIDVVLGISFNRDHTKVKLNQHRSKIIAREVKQWLEERNSNVESKLPLDLDEFTFEVYCRDKGFSTVQFFGFAVSFCVDSTPLRENIECKVHKYKHLAETNNMPLVVAVVADLRTNYGDLEMKTILFGQSFGQDLLNDGLFANKPLLTGVIRAWSPQIGKWQMQYYSNPRANHALPENLFTGL